MVVVTSILIGLVCAFIAYHTGRDPLRWFLGGLFLNAIALALIAAVGKLENRRASRART